MDCELFLESNLSSKSLAEIIQKIVAESVNQNVSLHNNEEEIVISTEFFSLALEIDDISDIAFVRNHYNLNVNQCIRIQLFGNTFYQGLEYLFKVIGKIMNKIDGNLLFLENGSDQLLRKENGQLIVNNDLNQYQKRYLTKSLLGLLDHSYIEDRLSN
ncbi:hypothetical protein ACFW1P_21440 [Paenibacillus sp. NPDC058910]|uniref:hypothetical protein n=1 Tax=unclassified Paenibacillus TaxID=185978 RepID=UPI0036B09B1E